jgi:predicted ATPase
MLSKGMWLFPIRESMGEKILEMDKEAPKELDLRTEMFGRDSKLNVLEQGLENAEEGHGNFILVSGEVGVGKTRLVFELMKLAVGRGIIIANGRCQDSETPFMPWINILKKINLEYILCTEPVKIVYASLFDHNKGMMLVDVKTTESEMDGDILSSMISAVQNFVKDSLSQFGVDTDGRSLNLMQYGNYSILLERGEDATIASVLEGKVNSFLVSDLKNTMENIHRMEGEIISSWSGAVSEVEHITAYLDFLVKKHRGVSDLSKIKDDKELLFQNVSTAINEYVTDSPLLIFIDDLHWADNSTNQLLHYVARAAKDKKVFIIGTYRPEEIDILQDTIEKMSREKLVSEVCLEKLDEPHVAEMIKSLYGLAPEGFVEGIFEKTGGNPFFVEEVLRTLESEGKIDPAVSSTLESIDPQLVEALPVTVKEVITRRLRSIEEKDPEAYMALEWMALAGDDLKYDFLFEILKEKIGGKKKDPEQLQLEIQMIMEENSPNAALRISQLMQPLEFDDSRASRILRTLLAAKLIKKKSTYGFDSNLLKDVVIGRIEPEARIKMHGHVGETMERFHTDTMDEVIEKVAYHFLNAGNTEKGFMYSMQAGEKALRFLAPEDALLHFQNAWASVAGNETLWEYGLKSSLKIAELERILGRWEDAISVCNRIIDTARQFESKDLEVMGAIILSDIYQKQGRYEDGLVLLEKALKKAEEAENRKLLADVYGDMSFAYYRLSRFEDGVRVGEMAVRIAEGIGDELGVAKHKSRLASSYGWLGNTEKKIQLLIENITTLEKNGEYEDVTKLYNNLGAAYSDMEDWGNAIIYYDKSLELARKTKNSQLEGTSLLNLGEAYAEVGDFESSKEMLDAGLQILSDLGDKAATACCYRNYGILYTKKRQWDMAEDNLLKSLNIMTDMNVDYPVADIHLYLAKMYFMKGDCARSLESAKKSQETFEKVDAHSRLEDVNKLLQNIENNKKK